MDIEKIKKLAFLHKAYLDHGNSAYKFILEDRDDCRRTVFDGLDLRNAIFKDVDLTYSTFFDTNLSNAVFRDCVLDNVYFNGANISGTKFIHCSMNNVRGKIVTDEDKLSLSNHLTAKASYGKIHYYKGKK